MKESHRRQKSAQSKISTNSVKTLTSALMAKLRLIWKHRMETVVLNTLEINIGVEAMTTLISIQWKCVVPVEVEFVRVRSIVVVYAVVNSWTESAGKTATRAY